MDPIPEVPQSPAMVRFDRVGLTLTSAAARVNVLSEVDFSVAAGERVAVLGPSGAGKSSLLALAGGLERPTSGRVTVAGRDLGQLDEDALARFRRAHVGIVFQSFHLIPTLTALENVALPLEFGRVANALDRAKDALEAAGLRARVGHYPAELSGGEQQRVAIARAIVVEPDVLLADEPTGNLDGSTGGAIADLIFGLVERRRATLMLVTHNEALARRCTRTIRLVDGRIDDPARQAAD